MTKLIRNGKRCLIYLTAEACKRLNWTAGKEVYCKVEPVYRQVIVEEMPEQK